MRKNRHISNRICPSVACLLFGFLFIILTAGDAHAYLNPGTGSFIFQLALAAFLGGLLTVRLYWNRVRAFFKRLFTGEKR